MTCGENECTDSQFVKEGAALEREILNLLDDKSSVMSILALGVSAGRIAAKAQFFGSHQECLRCFNMAFESGLESQKALDAQLKSKEV